MRHKKAVVLLSGGLDSSTVLYIAQRQGYEPLCLIFDYGQRHRKEILTAKKIAERAGAKHRIVKFKLPWGGSSLLDKSIHIPQCRSIPKVTSGVIPSTYVPARNTIFLSFAVSYAEAAGANAVFIGANSVDFSGYPDCRPSYFRAFKKLILEGTKTRRIKIIAPLLKKTKANIIRTGMRLGVPYGMTWSCYAGGKKPCGKCDSCILREKGFWEAGIEDPLL